MPPAPAAQMPIGTAALWPVEPAGESAVPDDVEFDAVGAVAMVLLVPLVI